MQSYMKFTIQCAQAERPRSVPGLTGPCPTRSRLHAPAWSELSLCHPDHGTCRAQNIHSLTVDRKSLLLPGLHPSFPAGLAGLLGWLA